MSLSPFLKGKRLARFLALQQALVPRSKHFDEKQRHEAERLVNRLLASRPPSIKLRLALFLCAIDGLSFCRGGRSFRKLSPAKQKKVLDRLFDSPIGLLRKGFWGLNTLAKLSVYGQPSVYPHLHYRLRETPHE